MGSEPSQSESLEERHIEGLCASYNEEVVVRIEVFDLESL
jgi:hypothetical protein